MKSQELFEEIRQTSTLDEKKQLLESRRALLSSNVKLLSELRDTLREAADATLHEDLEQSEQMADTLLYLADLMEYDPMLRALGLRVKGNVYCLGKKEFELALNSYNEAEDIYEASDRPDQKAATQAGKVMALAHLDRYEEAIQICEAATPILEKYEEWLRLGHLTMNVGSYVHGRRNEDDKALEMLDKAEDYYRRVSISQGRDTYLVWVGQNRANILKNLGHFDESIEITQRTIQILLEIGQPLEAARAKHMLAVTYTVLGRYNEALVLLYQAHDHFNNSPDEDETALYAHDIGLVEQDIVRCLLHLRRFEDVLARCQQMRKFFNQRNVMLELAQVMLYEGMAYYHLHQYEEALESLSEAQTTFSEQDSSFWLTLTRLELAKVYYRQKDYTHCLAMARSCVEQFQTNNLPIETAQAYLVGARAALELTEVDQAKQMLECATEIGQANNIQTLIYQCHHLAGQLEKIAGKDNFANVEAHWNKAIEALELLRGEMMVEFRSDFLSDKESIYADMALLYLELQKPTKSLEYVEKAKSGALLDLLTYRINLGLQARDPAHADVVQELERLRRQRDQHYYRWIGQQQNQRAENRTRDRIQASNEASTVGQEARNEIADIEKEITEIWHKLLILNADYAGDAALWQVKAEPIEIVQSYLNTKTALLEYYIAHDEILLFVVTHDKVTVHRLPKALAYIQGQLEWVQLSLETTPQFTSSQTEDLIEFVQNPLQELYDCLIKPVRDQITNCEHLYIVPHSSLHYLPFHALYDGTQYMVESYQISYLPNASFLRYCQPTSAPADQCYIFAHTNQGYLKNVVNETQNIVQLLQGHLYQDDQATIERVRQIAEDAYILHMATHGDFRADNPLFSGLVLEDGLLTTLDIFDLPLQNTALVTLSACQTGLSVIGGGDELLGLTRAFLSAGVPSLILSMWAVEDLSTAQLMQIFYEHLLSGESKVESLRQAQLALLKGANTTFHHPYYWAPFFLMGDEKALPH